MNKRFAQLLKEKFCEGLMDKTSWGRNDVRALFESCMTDAAMECLDGPDS